MTGFHWEQIQTPTFTPHFTPAPPPRNAVPVGLAPIQKLRAQPVCFRWMAAATLSSPRTRKAPSRQIDTPTRMRPMRDAGFRLSTSVFFILLRLNWAWSTIPTPQAGRSKHGMILIEEGSGKQNRTLLLRENGRGSGRLIDALFKEYRGGTFNALPPVGGGEPAQRKV
ncbi:hypothetical protein B0T21DRAFT_392606 [Apiosordaria backusii]|uniref:Uncharacterized protein n=1 Tax=Apiosordaria backusii TaxID=314023 RepID=A0AA40BNM9_9PEZI|nr:hypothetical protein B0T21DRAFT_392606 [Apiosordaria backusii]